MFFVLYSDDGNIFHNPFLFYFQIAIGGVCHIPYRIGEKLLELYKYELLST